MTLPEYEVKLEGLTDAELRAECEHYIWLSAYAANNPRSDYHWQCDATYDECVRRDKRDIYAAAHKAVMRKEGYA